MPRDTKMLTLLALKATKALLIAMKIKCDVPQNRLLDDAVEAHAIKLLGERAVRKIQKAMLDPVQADLLTREPVNTSRDATQTEAHTKTKPADAKPPTKRKTKSVRSNDEATTLGVSFLREDKKR